MTPWLLQDFDVGDISCQIIEFSVQGYQYVMIFNRIDASRSKELIAKQAEELGVEYTENSYEVKFDLRENFENDTFFAPPSAHINATSMKELGRIIKELLDFHYRNSNAEAYYCVAETIKLKRFYNRLANLYAQELYFTVNSNLGEEGLGYEITTPSYKS